MVIHVIYKICDYDNAKQDDGVRKTKCASSNDCTHASMCINHTVTSEL